jgi:effector-binding domain-containing protein
MRLPLLLAILLTPALMASYESPDYKVVSSEGSYEIRDYPAMTLVSTRMQNRSEDGSFMRLFGFISGSNDRGEKIAMTTPVLMSGENSGTMSFIVPKDVAAKGTPAPASPEVSLGSLPTARYAAYRYSGWVNPKREKVAAKKLLDWASARNLEVKGAPLFAYYNPPWTPWFLRRNEVLIPIAAGN